MDDNRKIPICACGHSVEDHDPQDPGFCLECSCKGFEAVDEVEVPPPPAPTPTRARTERREFKDFVYNPVVTWLRKVLGIADDQERAKAIASLMNSNFNVTTQLMSGLRQDLEALIEDPIRPTADIALELALRLEWYETHVESIRYALGQLQRERRKQAMRLETEHPTTPLPETPAPAEPERRGFDANGVAVPLTEEVPRGEDASS